MYLARLATALATAAAVSAVATAGQAAPVDVRVSDIEGYVLSHTSPEKLAAALSASLKQLPADDPRRAASEFSTLRGLLGERPVAAAKRGPQLSAPLGSFAILAQPQESHALAAPALAALPSFTMAALAAAAPAPEAPAKQFAAVLGRFEDAALAGSVWREISSLDPLAVKGLSANLVAIKGGGVTLVAGPLPDEDTAAGRCTAFASLGMACTAGAFSGKPLALASGPGG
jgi:hypothetical protein